MLSSTWPLRFRLAAPTGLTGGGAPARAPDVEGTATVTAAVAAVAAAAVTIAAAGAGVVAEAVASGARPRGHF